MKNPRLFFRVDGEVPKEQHDLLGYRVPLNNGEVSRLITKLVQGKEWHTIQIKIVPSLVVDQNKVIIISSQFKHLEADLEHSVFFIEEKTHRLIHSASTLEELFLIINKDTHE